jgi:hypothetical protein
MTPVAHPPTPPFGLRRLRRLAPLGWAVLAVWVWAAGVLPALHAVQHAREAQQATTSNRQRIRTLLDEVLGRTAAAPVRGEHHGHSHEPGGPARGPHGKGSIEHLDALFAAVAVHAVSPAFATLEVAPPIPVPAAPVLAAQRLARHPRGPPLLPTADSLSS